MEKTPHIESFLKHIFQDQYEKGLDYLDLLLFEPDQKLPVLHFPYHPVLSGKTTFFCLLKLLHKNHFVSLGRNEFLMSDYNTKWADKRIIVLDVSNGNQEEFAEKIKCFQTSIEIAVNGKHQEFVKCQKFIGCFIINGPIERETLGERAWEICPKKVETPDWMLLSKMEREIGEFKRFLFRRKRHFRRQGRLYFQ